MPKVKVLQGNFSSGVLSPQAMGRVDIARYPNAAKQLRNVISRTLGGVKKRDGTQYIAATKNSANQARLVPYIVSKNIAYMLEFGNNYMRVYKPDGTQVAGPYEIATPYTTAQVAELDYAQSEDALYFFHKDVYPNYLRTIADNSWLCANAPFEVSPLAESGEYLLVGLVLANNTVGSGRVITALSAVFQSSDVGRRILCEFGIAEISAFTDSTHVIVAVQRVFASTAIPSGHWNLDSSPQSKIKPSIASPKGYQVTLEVQTVEQRSNNNVAITNMTRTAWGIHWWVTCTAAGHGLTTGDKVEISGCVPDGYNGTCSVVVIDINNFKYLVSASLGAITTFGFFAIFQTITPETWRESDVGKYVRINGGLIKLSYYHTPTIIYGEIVVDLANAEAATSRAWAIQSPIWNSTNGYPRTGTIHQQRLITAGTKKNPQTVWGSRSGNLMDCTIGINDDDAFAFTLAGDNNQMNQIGFLVSARNLLALTSGGEFSLTGGVEKPITPTNVQIKPESPHGASTVRPVQVKKETVFVQRAGRKLRALGYNFQVDGYNSPDLTTLAEHITETGIACMAFQQEPEPVIWIALNNGRLISVTLDRDLEVTAWNDHETDGAVESIAVMPSGDKEQVWMIVRRSVNGSIVRYVERMQPDWYPIYGTASPSPNTFPPGDEPFSWGFQLDCAVTQDYAAGKATWTGLNHLIGKSVRCIADGSDMGTFTVSGAGSITLPRTAKRVLIGLMFQPSIVMLTPEIQLGAGSIHADAMSVNEIVLRFVNTIGATVDGSQVLPGRINGPDQLDMPPELFTGDKPLSNLGWNKGSAEVTIGQDAPFPFHLLAVIRSITVNGG